MIFYLETIPRDKYKEPSVLFIGETPQVTIDWADTLLETMHGFSLIGELNTMQLNSGVHSGVPTVFDNKYEIPFYFINLVLKDYNLKLKEGD